VGPGPVSRHAGTDQVKQFDWEVDLTAGEVVNDGDDALVPP
jgi:hypothetical protein